MQSPRTRRPTPRHLARLEGCYSRDRGGPLPEAEQRARMREGQAQGAATRREATRAELRAAVATLTAQGQPVNAENLSLVAGVSKRTVFNHSDIWN